MVLKFAVEAVANLVVPALVPASEDGKRGLGAVDPDAHEDVAAAARLVPVGQLLAPGACESLDLVHGISLLQMMIFSFSQKVWDDLLQGYIVIQDEDNYFILNFDNTDRLPKPTQQRSVLIKSFQATIKNITAYPKNEPIDVLSDDYDRIYNFKKNRNNHTTSDWNCIGIRVIPEI